MLTKQRQAEILALLKERGSITAQELKDHFGASESTIRRDLNYLHDTGALIKVFGGAVLPDTNVDRIHEDIMSEKKALHAEAKHQIGRYAASLIVPDDFVFIDAGSSTGCMIPFITEKSAKYVTNAVAHALVLSEMGFKVTLIGGDLKYSTEAIIGNEAILQLQKYTFTKGFFGSNAISRSKGFTTPDPNEAAIKEVALRNSREPVVLCDDSKFGHISAVRFADFTAATIITNREPSINYQNAQNILIAK